jgi:hypothetical protein
MHMLSTNWEDMGMERGIEKKAITYYHILPWYYFGLIGLTG